MTHKIPHSGSISWDDDEKNMWWRCPNCHDTGPLDTHEVTLYEDHTFSVSPSVICECGYHITIERWNIL